VNLGKRVYHCFACQAAGNVLEFVHRMENRNGEAVTLRRAGILLAEVSGIELGATNVRQGARKAKDGPFSPAALEGPVHPRQRVSTRLWRVGKGARQGSRAKGQQTARLCLTLDPSHPYLEERGIAPELIEAFGLGFCGKGIMAGRVCIPIHNADGATVAYAGRWVGPMEELPEGKGKYELPSGFRKELELFNLHRVAHCRHLIVVEGYFGAIRLHGLRAPAVALMGTSISVHQLELLAHANARHVTVMLDGDKAGKEAAETVAGAIANVAWSRIVHLPDGAQPDTLDRAQLERMLGRGNE
jgi:DNA primase